MKTCYWYSLEVLLMRTHNIRFHGEMIKISGFPSSIFSSSTPYHYYPKIWTCSIDKLGPVVQSVVSLTSLLRVIWLTVLAGSIYNILIFFAEKMWVAFALQKLLTFFSAKKFQHICISLDENFNESLTNDVVSFEQLGPGNEPNKSWWNGKQIRPWSNCSSGIVWPGSILFVLACLSVTPSTLGKIFSRWHFERFLLYFPGNRIWHFMQTVSNGDSLHEMSNIC